MMMLGNALSGQPLRVLTYNIRYDNPQDGENAWEKRRDFLCGQLEFYGPDVVGVQEALHHQLMYMNEKMPGFRYVGAGRDDGGTAGEYSAIFYRAGRLELLDSGTFWLSPTPEKPSKGWDAALNRVCTFALLRDTASGQTWWIFNTHFDHIGKEPARLRPNSSWSRSAGATRPAIRWSCSAISTPNPPSRRSPC